MNRLSDIGTIREILSRHGFTFSKALGQNFLINPTVCPRMAQESGAGQGVGVIEVGPGVGVLTNELCQLAEKVVAIELDKRLLPVLDETLAEYDNVKIVNGDVLKLDLNRLIAEEFPGMEVVVCANLPYYITSPGAKGSGAAHLRRGRLAHERRRHGVGQLLRQTRNALRRERRFVHAGSQGRFGGHPAERALRAAGQDG